LRVQKHPWRAVTIMNSSLFKGPMDDSRHLAKTWVPAWQNRNLARWVLTRERFSGGHKW
jgi:hypothetical protein